MSETGGNPTQPPQTPAPAPPPILKPLLAPPDVFNGDFSKFQTWNRTLISYIRELVQTNQVTSDNRAISIALSYMKGGRADDWVDVLIDDHCNEQTGVWNITFNDFLDKLKKDFTSVAKEKEARDRLKYIRQGKTSAEDFFKEFELLVKEAGYDKDDDYVLEIAEGAIDPSIMSSLIQNRTEDLSSYRELKKLVTGADNLRRRWAEQKRGYGYFGWNTNPQGQNRGQSSTQQQYSRQEPKKWDNGRAAGSFPVARRDSTGMTFGGSGRPMDLDRARANGLCFNCGERGHISRNCPKKGKAAVRNIEIGSTDTDTRSVETTSPSLPTGFDMEQFTAFANMMGFVKAPQ
ncbi:hypothetical protein F5880DRAFT_1616576 [Lentinula raphanica]|nr:hypothetical protein F5880DRAFT_1616576 [Lentinula raphanica]